MVPVPRQVSTAATDLVSLTPGMALMIARGRSWPRSVACNRVAGTPKAARPNIGLDRRSGHCPCEQVGDGTFMAERLDAVVARELGGLAGRWR